MIEHLMISNAEFIEGIAHELKFWKHFVTTTRFLNGWIVNTRTPEFRDEVYDFIANQVKQNPKARILDVGSGVISLLFGSVPLDSLVSIDPLADLYALIFDYKKYGIQTNAPIFATAENIPFFEEFDIVHMSNALDHCQDPFVAYRELTNACKPGGFIIIQGYENEGLFQKGHGFHKWNIAVSGGQIKIMSVNGLHNFEIDHYEGTFFYEKVESFSNGRRWYTWISQKPS